MNILIELFSIVYYLCMGLIIRSYCMELIKWS